jgi:hypothetical protein
MQNTIQLRRSVAKILGLKEAYALTIIETMMATCDNAVKDAHGRKWIAISTASLRTDMAPLKHITAYRTVGSLIAAGVIDSCRGASLGLRQGQGHLVLHYSIAKDRLQELEDAYATGS